MKYVCNNCGKIADEKETIILFKHYDTRMDSIVLAYCSEKCLKEHKSNWQSGRKMYNP